MSLLSTAAGCLPPKLRRTLRAALDAPARRAFQRNLEARPFSLPTGAPVLNYGEVLPRGPGAIVHGGRVKLLHLTKAFPENHERFNTLYLVSSAIPRHARELVQWARARGVKFVWNQNGVGFPAWAGGMTTEFNEPMAELRRAADYVVYQSAFCRESADRFLGPATGESSIIFNPVDLSAFTPSAQPPAMECWELLAAGTHHQPFRVLGAIETLRCLLDRGQCARLTVAGELRWAGAQAEVDAAVTRCRVADAIKFVPPFSQNEAAALYRGAHVLLHAKYHDPCPTIVIEALASGLPVVGSRSGGLPELVGDEGGELIEVPLSWEQAAYPTPAQFADAIELILRDWPARSRAARARAERLFDANAWVARHAEIFERLPR